MQCLGEFASKYQGYLDEMTDERLTWVLSEHGKDEWLRVHQPELKPELRLYMRLCKQEAHRRGLLEK